MTLELVSSQCAQDAAFQSLLEARKFWDNAGRVLARELSAAVKAGVPPILIGAALQLPVDEAEAMFHDE